MDMIITQRDFVVNTLRDGGCRWHPDHGAMDFPSRLRRFRKAAQLSQEELGLACGRSGQGWIGNFERGDRRPEFDDIPKLANALGIHPGQLFADLPPHPAGIVPEKLAEAHQILREDHQAAGQAGYDLEQDPAALVRLYEKLVAAGSNPVALAALGRDLLREQARGRPDVVKERGRSRRSAKLHSSGA